jgi:hypothetical protein
MHAASDQNIALISWLITGFIYTRYLQSSKRLWPPSLIATLTITFFVAFSLSATMTVRWIATIIDAGIALNFAWLLSYIFAVIDLYAAVMIAAVKLLPKNSQREERWLQAYLAITLTTLLVIYALFVRAIPSPLEASPANVPLLIFRLSLNTYALTMTGIAFAAAIIHAKKVQSPTIRLRTLAWVSGGFFPLLYFSVQFIAAVLLFANQFALALSLTAFSFWFPLLASFSFFIAFLPKEFFQWIYTCVARFWAVRDMRALRPITNRLEIYKLPIPRKQPNLLDSFLEPDFNLYQTIIQILDGKRLLHADLQDASDPHTHPGCQLHNLLVQVNDEADFPSLVRQYSRIGRQLKRCSYLG